MHKRSVVLLCLLFAVPQSGFAQVSLGVVGGTNRTLISGDSPPSSSFKQGTGYQAGVLLEYGLTRNVAINLQPSYARKSPQIEFRIDTGEEPPDRVRHDLDFDVVILRLMAHYAFGTARTRFYVTAGTEFTFIQDVTYRPASGAGLNLNDSMENFDFAVAVGPGVRSRAGPIIWFLETTFTAGMVDVVKGDPLQSGREQVVWKLRSGTLSAGFAVPIFGG